MRKIIAALQISLDGFIEGPHGELDWIDSWEDRFDLLPQIDTCILGAGMYASYEAYWSAVQADPFGVLPGVDRPATPGEVVWAGFAAQAPHVVLSTTLFTTEWKHTSIVRNVEAISALKRRRGKDLYAVGGGTLVSTLLNRGLVDEMRLVVRPIVLGGGKPLFRDLKQRHGLELAGARPLDSGMLRLDYRVEA